MEVIYTGIRQTPEMIVAAALQEDVDVIGLSCLSGAHLELFADIIDRLKQPDMKDVVVVAGGIIPDEDVPELEKIGVRAVFGPGTPTDEIVRYIHENIKEK